jgi:hypothetical protein
VWQSGKPSAVLTEDKDASEVVLGA